jgi:hypothetical protein
MDPVVVVRLEHALRLVQRDLDATLPAIGPLMPRAVEVSTPPELLGLVVGSRDDEACWNAGSQLDASDEEAALRSVAECTQEYVMEVHRRVWPTCRFHNRGLHLRTDESNSPVWRCNGHTGHTVSALGRLATTEPT